MPNPKPHNDLPTLEDELHWDNELERLCDRIRTCDTPHVMGIHGDWGSGKTSFMRQLQAQLGGEIPNDGSVAHCEKCKPPKERKQLQDQTITIWFDAWRYQHEPVPVVALLHEMRQQMAGLPAVKEKFKKLGEISLRYTLNSLADVGKVIGFEGLPSAEKIESLGERWEKAHYAESLHTDSIRTHLYETIKALLPNKKTARIVVFIDDLDRCIPKTAFRLLEGLKIYLSIPNCVFVLGMNERILVDAIREEIASPENASNELRAAHYLEKICSDIYRLPLPKDVAVLFSGWIEKGDHKIALQEAIDTTACLPPNPRRLKALFNQWQRFSQCVDAPQDAKDRPAWAVRALVAAYIHQFHRDIWERWHFNADFWNEFMAWCNGERSKNADGVLIPSPQWAAALKLTEQKTEEGDFLTPDKWQSDFPNPGDINIFWLDGLIRKYRDHLRPNDFIPLLHSGQKTA